MVSMKHHRNDHKLYFCFHVTAILPLMDVSCLEKVNSWLENCVEDDADSLHSSIELWRGEDITGRMIGSILFYCCLSVHVSVHLS